MSPVLPVVAAYLVGATPFAYLAVRVRCGVDIRRVGSGNAGATNVLRTAGLGTALAVLVCDIAKGALPVWAAREVGLSPSVLAACTTAAVAGHVFPVYLGFRGGKGVATAVGGLGVLAPGPTAAAVLVLLTVVLWKRYVSLGSIVALALVPLLLAAEALVEGVRPETPWTLGAASAVALLVVSRHRDNLRRLASGTERRIGERAESLP